MNRYKNNRDFLKTDFKALKNIKTDKQMGLPAPSFLKGYNKDEVLITLPNVNKEILVKPNVYDCLEDRRSVRMYSEKYITLEELSYLLTMTSGIQSVNENTGTTLRRVPSGGASHTFETYLIINRVEGLDEGVYRYLPLENKLIYMYKLHDAEEKIDEATDGQPFVQGFVSKSAVIFAWSCIPYRAEYRFDTQAHKKLLIDVGHVCQNLYIASESINCGTCAIGIYDQKLIDKMLNLDGEDEFIIYMAAVGKKKE